MSWNANRLCYTLEMVVVEYTVRESFMTADVPLHLALPLLSSFVFAIGLIILKRANQQGISPLLVTVSTNLVTAVVFLPFWFLGGTILPWSSWWQPVMVGVLYMVGQVCTFMAVERGDVSVAAPLLSVKVVLVAIFLTLIDGATLPWSIWLAAVIATLGIATVQRSQSRSGHRRVLFTIVFALLAAATYALFDVVVQRWARTWGPGRLLPLGFLSAGLISLVLWPWCDRAALVQQSVRRPLIVGCILFALQSLGIAISIGVFGDAARVNIVYSLRGIWGVILSWVLARKLGTNEREHSRGIMVTRLIGAGLLTIAVFLAIFAR